LDYLCGPDVITGATLKGSNERNKVVIMEL
jgi:hypothetical protein